MPGSLLGIQIWKTPLPIGNFKEKWEEMKSYHCSQVGNALVTADISCKEKKNWFAYSELWFYTEAVGFPSDTKWEDPLEKGMATHSSILAWRISWTEEPGGLQSTGGVRHDWSDLAQWNS